jgi:hypothetical protein
MDWGLHYRSIAALMRQHAATVSDRDCRTKFMSLAADYEKLAEEFISSAVKREELFPTRE